MTVHENEHDVALPSLVVPASSFVADPVHSDPVDVGYDRVDVAAPTHDADRHTIHVPSEETVLSLGAASPRWKTDIGITGYTNAHVHFETKTGDHKTIVSLGESAHTAAIHGFGSLPPSGTEGYAMVTDGHAWHESQGQHYILAQEGDMLAFALGAGRRVVVQADAGGVDLNGEEVTLSGGSVAIGAASGLAMQLPIYDAAWQPLSVSTTSADNAKLGMDCIGILTAGHDLVLAAAPKVKAVVARKVEMSEYFWADVANWGFSAAQFTINAMALYGTFTKAASPPGCVKISAEKDIVGVAGVDTGLFGSRSAALGGGLFANVGAGLMATLKGTVFAGVSAILSSLKGVKKVEVASTYGDVVVGAAKDVTVLCPAEVALGGEELAQLSSEKAVLIGGATRAWVGAGDGDGFGLLFDASGVAFGKATGTAKMGSASIKSSPAVRVDTGKIEIAGPNGAVTLTDDLCLVEAPKVRLDAKQKNVTINGSQILLG